MLRCPVVLFAMLLAAGGVHADTIHVPAEVATIQEAVTTALPGDEILVAPGVYVESIVARVRDLTIRGTGGAAVTVLEAAGGTALRVEGPPGPGVLVVEGLTIRGGTGSVVTQTFGPPLVVGGGVVVDVKWPAFALTVLVLRSCEIRDNKARDAGGGMWTNWTVLVEDCLFEGNRTKGDGGGLWMTGQLDGSIVRDSVFRANLADGHGGGYVLGNRSQVVDSVVEANVAGGDGGGGFEEDGANWVGPERVRYLDNRAGGVGGGLAVRREVGFSVIGSDVVDLAFLGNEAVGDGGGMYVHSWSNGGSMISNNSIGVDGLLAVGNVAGGVGGGLAGLAGWPGALGGNFDVVDGTFLENMANRGGDALDVQAGSSSLSDSIVWQEGASVLGATPPEVSWSQVLGGWPGEGNDDADPLFVDPDAGDYRLRGGSPCIDSGDPLAPVDADGSPADRGALPFEPWVDAGPGLAGALGEPLLVGSGLNATLAETTLIMSGAPPFLDLTMVFGFSELGLPLKGGVLVPSMDWLLPGLLTDAEGSFEMKGNWAPQQVPDSKVWVQGWLPDPTGPFGWTATNAVLATTR